MNSFVRCIVLAAVVLTAVGVFSDMQPRAQAPVVERIAAPD